MNTNTADLQQLAEALRTAANLLALAATQAEQGEVGLADETALDVLDMLQVLTNQA